MKSNFQNVLKTMINTLIQIVSTSKTKQKENLISLAMKFSKSKSGLSWNQFKDRKKNIINKFKFKIKK